MSVILYKTHNDPPPIIVKFSFGPPLFSKKNRPGPPHDFSAPAPHISNDRSLKIRETFHRSTFPSFRQALSTKSKLQTPSFFLNGVRVRSRSASSAVLVVFNLLYDFFTWLALSKTVRFKTRICLQTVKGILRNLKQLKSINEFGD